MKTRRDNSPVPGQEEPRPYLELRFAAVALFACLCIARAVDAHAQDVTGHIHGRVVTEDRQPAGGVVITAEGASLQGTRTVETDERGRFRFLALPGGTYTVRARRIGYRPVVLERVPVLPGQTTSLEAITLELQPVQLASLTVEGDRPVVDPTSTTLGTTLDSRAFEALPTSRDYRSIVTLLPQANVSFYGDRLNISGTTGFDNAYYIDGVNVTEPHRGDGAIGLPYNFIDHIELKSGGFGAEYGRTLGGIVSVVTSAGGNEHRGSVFAFFTNSGLSSRIERGLLDLRTGRFTRYDVGASLGGPIIRNRLWYFLAYDAQAEREDVQLPGLNAQTDRSVAHRFAGKLTWHVTPHTDLTLTVLGDPTTRDLVGNVFHGATAPPRQLTNPDPFLAELRTGGVAVSLRGKHVVGQHLLLEGSLARFDTRFATEGATERGRRDVLFVDATTSTWSGGHGGSQDHHSVRTSAGLTGTYYSGDHSVKAGVQYEENFLDTDWLNMGSINKRAQSLYVALLFNLRAEVRNRVASLFGEGSFRLHPRLRFKAGLRWDGQYFKGLTTGLGGSITDQLQPRVGLVLYPGRGESQKVTVSYGRFYEQIPNAPISAWYGGPEAKVSFFDQNPLDDPSRAPFRVLRFTTRAANELKGQHYDEFTVGYERLVGRQLRVAVGGIYRTLREILATFPVTADTELAGNPGRGRLDVLPKPEHRYLALELSLSRFSQRGLSFLGSYVLSRTHGNYTGLYDQDRPVSNPHGGGNFNDVLSLENGAGPLPNDRPQVFKMFGSYGFAFGLTVGTSFSLQSGTPLNELGANPNPFNFVFLRPRGTAGRTPFLWDWNLHLGYDLASLAHWPVGSVLNLDVLHAFSAKRPVKIEQRRFLAVDLVTGNQISPNPNYLAPLVFQPPMTVRLGAELRF